MIYLLHGTNEGGDPVSIPVMSCWRCLSLVNLSLGTMEDHADRQHPPVPSPDPEERSRHGL